jgi:hypothetical protein
MPAEQFAQLIGRDPELFLMLKMKFYPLGDLYHYLQDRPILSKLEDHNCVDTRFVARAFLGVHV